LYDVTKAESGLSFPVSENPIVNEAIEVQRGASDLNLREIRCRYAQLPRAGCDLWWQEKINSCFLSIFRFWRQVVFTRNGMLSDAYFLYCPCGLAVVLNKWGQPQDFDLIGLGNKLRKFSNLHCHPSTLTVNQGLHHPLSSASLKSREKSQQERSNDKGQIDPDSPEYIMRAFLGYGILFFVGWGLLLSTVWFFDFFQRHPRIKCLFWCVGVAIMAAGSGFYIWMHWQAVRWEEQHHKQDQGLHSRDTVTQKYFLTSHNYCNTLIARGEEAMANVLDREKQVAVISALAEGSGIRQIERITGVHRDTIMRLGVRVGQRCAALLDRKMRGLSCEHLQFDEVWGFIGKKQRHVQPDDDPQYGDVWTFCAIDADTKLVPTFKVGKRDSTTANAFVSDLAGRLKNRAQISSDALRAYVEAVELAFGADVDFAQIVKTFTRDESQAPERQYSAPEFVVQEKVRVVGSPDMNLASTSYVERLNGTTRLHIRRLTRLTYAFSKKLENFEAAVALHFAYYNFVKRHRTLRTTPAMAAGIERDFWTVGDLLEAA